MQVWQGIYPVIDAHSPLSSVRVCLTQPSFASFHAAAMVQKRADQGKHEGGVNELCTTFRSHDAVAKGGRHRGRMLRRRCARDK